MLEDLLLSRFYLRRNIPVINEKELIPANGSKEMYRMP
jgi:hypothetical protein